VALYATFLNRAFDQMLLDVALHKAGVTFVLDRAGVTGPDGASHHGMWDLTLLHLVPGLRLAAPRDVTTLREELADALDVTDGPTVLRFPKASVGPDIPAVRRVGGVDVLLRTGEADVLLVSVGAMAGLCLDVAGRLSAQGLGVTVVDPRWLKPVDDALVGLARDHRLVATVEDSSRVGGYGAALALALRDAGVGVPVQTFGLPDRFLVQGSRTEVLTAAGLTAQQVSRAVVERVASLEPQPSPEVEQGDQPGVTPLGD
jgi:1-deoxy-D-xylulose-5-phosphate synthase